MIPTLDNLKEGTTHRESSYDRSGGNADFIRIGPKSSYIMAEIKGPGKITHIWMTSWGGYRNNLIKVTYDDMEFPSINVPYGDFFGQGNCIVNSYQSLFFTSSTNSNNKHGELTALNCYLPMPFKKSIKIELVNESDKEHTQYFYIDYEKYDEERSLGENPAYLHAEFRREYPFGGWGPEIKPNVPEVDGIMNKELDAWNNNYIIMETKGRGHYIGCFYNVVNLQSKNFNSYGDPGYSWWGEGDDMIWVDGYKWPPDLHGTGSEDYFNQALGMQRNAFLRNGTTIHEFDTEGYSTSYIFHVENPVRFKKEIKVTIENGHANHLGNDISSLAFWYAENPTKIINPPSLEKRQPIKKIDGKWIIDPKIMNTNFQVPITQEMNLQKNEWKRQQLSKNSYKKVIGTICTDENNKISMKIKIGPNYIMDIPFNEVLDDLIDENNHNNENMYIRINLFGEIRYIKKNILRTNFIDEISSLLKPHINNKIKIISGIVLENEVNSEFPANLCIIITNKITFRD